MVRAAARLFSARGYHGTSMQDLGEALGLRRGSLYAHIGSKEELLLDVVEDGAGRFLSVAQDAIDLDGSASDRLRSLLVGHITTAAEHLDAATVFLNEWRYLSAELRAQVQAKRDLYEGSVRRIIAEGVRSGELRADIDIQLAATLVLSAGNWAFNWYRPGGGLTPEEVGARFADLIVKGLSEERSQP